MSCWDADGLGVDLHQLRQRVLQAPRDGDGGAEVHVVVGELLRRQLGRGVDGRARLADDHVAQAPADLADELDGHGLRLAGGGAVADGDVGDVVAPDHGLERVDGLTLASRALRGVDDGGVQHLARAVDHRDLAAVGVAGVEAHGDVPLDGRLHQQRLQIQREGVDRALGGRVGEVRADLTLQRRFDEPVVGVLTGGAQERHGGGAALDERAVYGAEGKVAVHRDADLQKALLLAAVERQHLMPLHARHGLDKVVVEPVDAVLLRRRRGAHEALLLEQRAQRFAEVRVVGDALGDDIAGTRERVVDALDALFRVDVGLGEQVQVGQVLRLREDGVRQRLQPLLLRHGGAGAAFGLVGPVEVFDLRERLGVVDGGGELLGQLALLLDGRLDRLAPLLQRAEVGEAFLQRAQRRVVHGAVELLAVAGDEGDGVALVEQFDHGGDVRLAAAELFGNDLYNAFHENDSL